MNNQPAIMPSLIAGYVTVPVNPDKHEHLCDGCAFNNYDVTTQECLDVVCCEGVIFRKMKT